MLCGNCYRLTGDVVFRCSKCGKAICGDCTFIRVKPGARPVENLFEKSRFILTEQYRDEDKIVMCPNCNKKWLEEQLKEAEDGGKS